MLSSQNTETKHLEQYKIINDQKNANTSVSEIKLSLVKKKHSCMITRLNQHSATMVE